MVVQLVSYKSTLRADSRLRHTTEIINSSKADLILFAGHTLASHKDIDELNMFIDNDKTTAVIEVKENAIIYDPIVVENVEAFTYKRKNTIISIKGQPGSDCLLGYGAFQDCKKLKKADFSECNTLFVDHDVFSGCYDLEEVKFPQNATIREEFSGCSKLFDNGFLISDRTLYRYNGNEENVEIPDGIKRIYDGAFFENGTLKTIKIPNTLTHTEKDSKA